MIGSLCYSRENGALIGEITADRGANWQVRNRFEQTVEIAKDKIILEAATAAQIHEKYRSTLQDKATERAVVSGSTSSKAKVLNLAAILCLLFLPIGCIPVFFLARAERRRGFKLQGHLLSAYIFSIWGIVHVVLGILIILRSLAFSRN